MCKLPLGATRVSAPATRDRGTLCTYCRPPPPDRRPLCPLWGLMHCRTTRIPWPAVDDDTESVDGYSGGARVGRRPLVPRDAQVDDTLL